VAVEDACAVTCLNIPEPDGLVRTAGQVVPLRTEGDRIDRVGVADEVIFHRHQIVHLKVARDVTIGEEDPSAFARRRDGFDFTATATILSTMDEDLAADLDDIGDLRYG